MKQYSYLVRRKARAVGVFTAARAKLQAVLSDMSKERELCHQVIDSHTQKADFLTGEMAHASATIEQINRVVGV